MSKSMIIRIGFALVLWASFSVTGCEQQPPVIVDADPGEAGSVAAAPPAEETPSQPAAQKPVLGETKSPAALAEECCTDVGKKDECWWEDASADGVVCKDSGDCAAGETCHSSGLCTCDDDADCDLNPNKTDNIKGVCASVDHDNNPGTNKIKLCGPSYCNGFLQCDCWGGCTWWDADPNLTPAMDAAAQGLVCCEGTYPEGGSSLITYYAPTVCGGSAVGGCTNVSQCPPPTNQCHSVACTAGACQYTPDDGKACTPVATGDCYTGTGTCNAAGNCIADLQPAGTDCGDDHAADECLGPDQCDAVGNCVPDLNFEPAGTACGNSHAGNECWNPDECDGSGTCITTDYEPAGTLCGSDRAADPCLDHDLCNGTGTCVNDPEPAGTACTLDPDVYPVTCFTPLCGDVVNDVANLTYTLGAANGVCEAAIKSGALNDTCANLFTGTTLNTTNPGYIGVFGNNFADGNYLNDPASEVLTVSGSTRCAVDDYQSTGQGCLTGGVNLGADGPDTVYAFEYDTNGLGQNQLYGFVITLESSFDGVVYTRETANTVTGCPAAGNVWSPNRCLPTITGGSLWEDDANKLGNALVSQQCCPGCNTNGYYWCERDTWDMTEAPVPFGDALNGAPAQKLYSTVAGRTNVSSTVVYGKGIRPTNTTGSRRRVLIYVDGMTAADKGDFTLSVERRVWSAGPCERINDDPRVYNITLDNAAGSEGLYQGNLTAAVNSWHTGAGTACGGFPCTNTWKGVTSSHVGAANAFWPNVEYFKIQPPTGAPTRDYCVKLVAPTADAADAVVEVRYPTVAPHTGALCDLNAFSVLGTATVDNGGVTIPAVAANDLYLVGVSSKNQLNAPCTNNCSYQLEVTEGACPAPPSTGATCNMSPVQTFSCPGSPNGGIVTPAGVIDMDTLSGSVMLQGELNSGCSDSFSDPQYNLPSMGHSVQWMLRNRTHRMLTYTISVIRRPIAQDWFTISWGYYKCNGVTAGETFAYQGGHQVHTIPGWYPNAWNGGSAEGAGNMNYKNAAGSWPSYLGSNPDIYNQNVQWAGHPGLPANRPDPGQYLPLCSAYANGGNCCKWYCPGPMVLNIEFGPRLEAGNVWFPTVTAGTKYYYDLYVSWTDNGEPW